MKNPSLYVWYTVPEFCYRSQSVSFTDQVSLSVGHILVEGYIKASSSSIVWVGN